MSQTVEIALVRCRLDGPPEEFGSLRYIPLGEFGLWRYLMETRHARRVQVESVSVWVPEDPVLWNSGYAVEALEPVLRVSLRWRGEFNTPTPVERFFPAETYPRAQEALLSHLPGGARAEDVRVSPGYFVPREKETDRQAVALA